MRTPNSPFNSTSSPRAIFCRNNQINMISILAPRSRLICARLDNSSSPYGAPPTRPYGSITSSISVSFRFASAHFRFFFHLHPFWYLGGGAILIASTFTLRSGLSPVCFGCLRRRTSTRLLSQFCHLSGDQGLVGVNPRVKAGPLTAAGAASYASDTFIAAFQLQRFFAESRQSYRLRAQTRSGALRIARQLFNV